MPRTKLDRVRDPYEKYRAMILGRMAILDYGYEELAARLGVSPPTARRYVREPGSMTMDSMRKMNRVLDVSAEDARANLAVK